MVRKVGKGLVKVGVSHEELEDSINGLSLLKPILQAQVIKSNGANRLLTVQYWVGTLTLQ